MQPQNAAIMMQAARMVEHECECILYSSSFEHACHHDCNMLWLHSGHHYFQESMRTFLSACNAFGAACICGHMHFENCWTAHIIFHITCMWKWRAYAVVLTSCASICFAYHRALHLGLQPEQDDLDTDVEVKMSAWTKVISESIAASNLLTLSLCHLFSETNTLSHGRVVSVSAVVLQCTLLLCTQTCYAM